MNLLDVDLDALEPAQRSSAMQHRLPRRKLSRTTLLLLWLLRVYVIVAVPLVVLAFVRALQTG